MSRVPGVSAAACGVPVATVVRSGFVESVHHGTVVVLDAGGRELLAVGDPQAPVFPRSSNKPVQAAAMVRAGLDVEDELLALAAASHSGEPEHLDGVRKLLASAGLTEADLQNTPDLPLDPRERERWLAAGERPSSIAQNCSGKHAAMLATCQAAGWDLRSYLDPGHPLQRLVAEVLAELAQEPVAHVGVDGCGAPVLAVSLTGLARAFSAVVRADAGTAEHRVGRAVRAFPRMVGGSRRDVTALMQAVPGLLAKDGAEAVYGAALADGTAVAVKITDGGNRARPVVLAQALREAGVDPELVAFLDEAPVLGHGRPVGAVRALPLRG
ncbi:MAG TPA: asparaginase [Actinomycetales bacterium]|nr:asparaginase [Actinomycetales bacterium]